MDATFRELINQDWITILLALSLVLITLARAKYASRFTALLRILQSESYFSGSQKEMSYWHPLNLLMTLIQLISIPLFIYILYARYQGWPVASKPFVFVQILAGYIVFFALKNSLEYAILWILNLKSHLQNYYFKKFSYRNIFGILLFILSSFLVYTSSDSLILIYISFGILGLVLLISTLNFISNYRSQIIGHPFYFILYFCALELAPYYLVIKSISAYY